MGELREVPGWPGYLVSDDGRVFSCWLRGANPNGPTASPRVMQTELRERYAYACLRAPGRRLVVAVHALILTVFVGPRPAGAVTRHLNGNGFDNRLCNLAWGTQAENAADAIAHGTFIRGERSPNAKLTAGDVRKMRARAAKGKPTRALAREFGISQTQARRVVDGKSWASVGGAT